MIAGMGYLTDFKPGFSFSEIDQQFPGKSYEWLRLLPTLAGTLLPLIIFLLALELGISKESSFVAAMAIILENAMLVQSRFILLDAFLLLFGFSALLCYMLYRRKDSWGYFILGIIFSALALSIKWTGLSFLAIIILAEGIVFIRKPHISALIPKLTAFLLIPLIYFSIFFIHFKLLPHSGPGDPYMTSRFQKTLTDNKFETDTSVKPLSIIQKFIELNKEMYQANATLTAGHPYSSKWYTWPFMVRPIYYWYEGPKADLHPGESARIYFLGNPVIWWFSTIAIIYTLLDLLPGLQNIRKLREFFSTRKLSVILSTAYLINLLPFVGISRAMFLYHYMIDLVIAIIALGYIIDQFPARRKIALGVIVLAMASFIFFAPLSYGTALSDHAFKLHIWFPSWE